MLPPRFFEHWLSFLVVWYAATVALGSEALRVWCAERRLRRDEKRAELDADGHHAL